MFGPSPETSITSRVPSNPLPAIEAVASATASPMAFPPGQNIGGKARILPPKALALAPSETRVQPTLTRSQPGPANSI